MKASLGVLAASLLFSPLVAKSKPEGAIGYLPRATAPRTVVIVMDLSASRSAEMLDESKQFLAQIAHRLNFGDRVALLQMQQNGLSDHPAKAIIAMPARTSGTDLQEDKDDLEDRKNAVAATMKRLFAPAPNAAHTDIFSTLHVVAEVVRDGGSRPATIILLSDMLQSAGPIEFEHLRAMPPRNFIPEQQRKGLMPNLAGACVVVVGADTASTSGVTIRNFWMRYFAASGANLNSNNYRYTPPPADQLGCN